MNIMTFILTITMTWIVLFFIALPIAVKMPDKVQKGNADSAPEKHFIFAKSIITFLLALIISILHWYIFYT